MYFGFDTGSGKWPSGRSSPYLAALLDVRDWYKLRNDGDLSKRTHTRECIREAIATARTHLPKKKLPRIRQTPGAV